MKPLTLRQQQVFNFIKDQITYVGMPPTRAEIAAKLGFKSANAAEEHLKALARKGVIEMIAGSSRGIRLPIGFEKTEIGIPLVGYVAAGSPILAAEHIEDYYLVDRMLFKNKVNFLLRVNGMSMKDVSILDGDLLAIHKTNIAENGQIIVARIDDEVTVKRFNKRNNAIWLIAENAEFAPIVVDSSRVFVIEGLVVGVIRNNSWM